MIRINNFLHRQKFVEITRRWLHDRLEPDDLFALKELINYNSIWMGRVSQTFASWLFERAVGGSIEAFPVNSKGELKDLLVEHPPYLNERIKKLCKRYQERPERYFRETPFLGVLYAQRRGEHLVYVGSTRIKRVRRIAEKGARRIGDFIFRQIKRRAQRSAEQLGGLSASLGFSSPEELLDDFERAERRIGMELQRGHLFHERIEFVIEDVLGVKVIAEDHEQAQVLRLIEQDPCCEIVEIEQHRGHYNGTNVIIRYSPEKERLLQPPLSDASLQRLAWRGLKPERVPADFREFVLSGEDAIHVELILSNFEEMLESEIGRSMHEERLMRQRMQAYRGHLSRNVSYLMEFIFACGISPCVSLDDIPIKVWIQYVPDYFDEVIKRLFNIPTFRAVE